MFADLVIFGLVQALVLAWPDNVMLSHGLRFGVPIEPEQPRYIRAGDASQQEQFNPVYGVRIRDYKDGLVTESGEDVSIIIQRNWCPSSYWISPCVCDGPKQFTLLTCNGLSSVRTLQRIFETYYPKQNFGKFTMTHSEIESLTKGDLGTLKFEYIFMKKNTLKSIDAEALEGSKDTLKRLEIVHNDLEKFPFKNVSQFTKLEYIDLKYNAIKNLPDFAFGYHHTLKEIDLSFNKISYIGSYAFDRLPELKSLNLSYNKLAVLNNHALASNVVNRQLTVDLSHNQLLYIADGAFDKRTMDVLDLSYNNLKTLQEEIFGRLVNDMANNKNGVIVLNDNRFLCTCKNVEWLVRKPESYKRPLLEFFCTDLNKYLLHITPEEIGCSRLG